MSFSKSRLTKCISERHSFTHVVDMQERSDESQKCSKHQSEDVRSKEEACYPIVKDFANNKSAQIPSTASLIIWSEVLERFTYYGIRTILALYLTKKLGYDEDMATIIYHGYIMLCFMFAILGVILVDSGINKIKCIVSSLCLYSVGVFMLTAASIETLLLPEHLITIISLLLIAICTGIIKPCASNLAVDQIQEPKLLPRFFNIYYCAINISSISAIVLVPILRADVHCLVDNGCYALAFGVPSTLLLFSLIVFIIGIRQFTCSEPTRAIQSVAYYCSKTFYGWRRNRNWLDYAGEGVDRTLVKQIKCMLNIIMLYFPLSAFWTLFDQQSSRWVFQATRMNGQVGILTLKPEQMQLFNLLLLFILAPIFRCCLYPLLQQVGLNRAIHKITLGGFLAGIAFVMAAALEIHINIAGARPLNATSAQLRVYNGMQCHYEFMLSDGKGMHSLKPLEMWSNVTDHMESPIVYKFIAVPFTDKCLTINSIVRLQPGEATSYFITGNRLKKFFDWTTKPKSGESLIRLLFNIPEQQLPIQLMNHKNQVQNLNSNFFYKILKTGQGQNMLRISDKMAINFKTREGGTYALILQGNSKNGYNSKLLELLPPYSMSMLWQLPQIFVISAAELLFCASGWEFFALHTPQNMRPILQLCSLLAVAVGNMLVIFVSEWMTFYTRFDEFIFYASFIFTNMFIFIILAKYIEQDVSEFQPQPLTTTLTDTTSNGD